MRFMRFIDCDAGRESNMHKLAIQPLAHEDTQLVTLGDSIALTCARIHFGDEWQCANIYETTSLPLPQSNMSAKALQEIASVIPVDNIAEYPYVVALEPGAFERLNLKHTNFFNRPIRLSNGSVVDGMWQPIISVTKFVIQVHRCGRIVITSKSEGKQLFKRESDFERTASDFVHFEDATTTASSKNTEVAICPKCNHAPICVEHVRI